MGDSDREDSPDADFARPRASRNSMAFGASTLSPTGKISSDMRSSLQPSLNRMSSTVIENTNNQPTRKLDRGSTITEGVGGFKMPIRNTGDGPQVSVKFKSKDEWQDTKDCFVCQRTFDKIKGVFTHHCRICGKSICGECSTKKIMNERVCDVCYYRASTGKAEERRKDAIKNKKQTIENYKVQLKVAKDELNITKTQQAEAEKNLLTEKEMKENAKANLKKEHEKAYDNMMKKMESARRLKETLDTDKEILRNAEAEEEELRTKINSLKLEVSQKKNIYNSKKEEFARLQQQKISYEASQSFLDVTGGQGLHQDSIISSNNYSIASTDAIGRLSLANAPTKI